MTQELLFLHVLKVKALHPRVSFLVSRPLTGAKSLRLILALCRRLVIEVEFLLIIAFDRLSKVIIDVKLGVARVLAYQTRSNKLTLPHRG